MAVDPARIYEMARDLAKGVLELLDEAPAEWDGGGLGYLVGGLHTDATALLAAMAGESPTGETARAANLGADAGWL